MKVHGEPMYHSATKNKQVNRLKKEKNRLVLGEQERPLKLKTYKNQKGKK